MTVEFFQSFICPPFTIPSLFVTWQTKKRKSGFVSFCHLFYPSRNLFKSRFSPYVQRALIERSTAADPCLIFVKDLWVCDEKDAAQREEKPTPQEGVKLNFVCLILSHFMFIVTEIRKEKLGALGFDFNDRKLIVV